MLYLEIRFESVSCFLFDVACVILMVVFAWFFKADAACASAIRRVRRFGMRCCDGRLFLTDSVLIDGEEVLFGVSFGSALYGLMLDFPECVRQAVPRYGFADAEEDMCRLCRMCRGIRVDVVFLMGGR